MQLTGPAELEAAPEKKLSPSFAKIKAAIEAEERATQKPFPKLRPGERFKRLADRMLTEGMKDYEIPNIRTFWEYFNRGPGKSAKTG
jgi:hypothetical protein